MNYNRELLLLTKDLLVDYNRFENNDIRVIGYPGYLHADCLVNTKFDYLTWIRDYKNYSAVKVEGLETIDAIKSKFKKFTVKNIHLFVAQKFGYSFNWHRDNLNVFLYVIKGRKTVFLRDRKIILNPGQGVIIPKHHTHKVYSRADTWALSVGY